MANDIFDVSMQDRVWKQQFFYNAFRALAFNRIDGDYAEFGCWSGSSFWLAHLESRRHGHNAHLWAFDSFQGLRQGRNSHIGLRRRSRLLSRHARSDVSRGRTGQYCPGLH